MNTKMHKLLAHYDCASEDELIKLLVDAEWQRVRREQLWDEMITLWDARHDDAHTLARWQELDRQHTLLGGRADSIDEIRVRRLLREAAALREDKQRHGEGE